ncbi:hypothetical protein ACJWR5_14115 [Klebsiella pneumoniae]
MGPDPRNFNQRVSLGRNDLLIRTFPKARAAFPGWDLVFAAKIRAQAPCRVAFFDYTTRRGWEFDSAAIQEVRHA